MPILRFATAVLVFTVASTSVADQKKEAGLSKSEIMSVVMTHVDKVKDCFKQALAKNSTLKGTVVVAWTVQPYGRVAGARVTRSTMNNSDVDTCIVGEVATWMFPKSPAKSEVNAFPFVLKS